jgi:hypothetical protein
MNRLSIGLILIALFLLSAPGFAAVSTSFPFTGTVFVPCAAGGAGETVALSGELHSVVSTVINGDRVHLMEVDNPQDITGVGLTTGDRYQGAGVTRFDANFTVALFPIAFTYVDAFHIIGTGPNNNFVVHVTEHVTINGDNTVVVMFDNVSVTCR